MEQKPTTILEREIIIKHTCFLAHTLLFRMWSRPQENTTKVSVFTRWMFLIYTYHPRYNWQTKIADILLLNNNFWFLISNHSSNVCYFFLVFMLCKCFWSTQTSCYHGIIEQLPVERRTSWMVQKDVRRYTEGMQTCNFLLLSMHFLFSESCEDI